MNTTNEGFYLDIGRVAIAHEFTLDIGNRCDYSQGRNVSGISLALEGEVEYRLVSGQRYRIKSGDLLFLPAETAYVIDVKESYRHYTVNFTLHNEYSDKILTGGDIVVLHTENAQNYINTFARLCETWSEKKSGYEMRATMYVYRLLEAFISEMNAKKLENNLSYHRLIPAKEYIDASYTQKITLKELAKLCDMSETNFRRMFLCVFGETPICYRDNVRLLHARELLASGYCGVSEVAVKCGFDDVSYFCRFFKKHTGMTPLEYAENGM